MKRVKGLKAFMTVLGMMGDVPVSQELADYVNHNFGNVKRDGCITQYVFREGDMVHDITAFLKKFYTDEEDI